MSMINIVTNTRICAEVSAENDVDELELQRIALKSL